MHSESYTIYIPFCSVDGHAICPPGSCVPKKKFPVLIVALVALAVVVVVVIVAVLIFIFVFRKKKTSKHVEGTYIDSCSDQQTTICNRYFINL